MVFVIFVVATVATLSIDTTPAVDDTTAVDDTSPINQQKWNTFVPASSGPATKQSQPSCIHAPTSSETDALFTVNLSTMVLDKVRGSAGIDRYMVSKEYHVRKVVHDPSFRPSILGKTGRTPSIALIGSSHCSMHVRVIEQIAIELNESVGVLCMSGDYGRFSDSNNPKSWIGGWPPEITFADKLSFDAKRRMYLRQWRPRLIVWMDLWGGTGTGTGSAATITNRFYYNRPDAKWSSIVHDLASLVPRARIKIFGDVPQTGLGGNGFNLIKGLYLQYGNFNFINKQREPSDSKLRRNTVEAQIQAACASHPSVSYVNVDRFLLAHESRHTGQRIMVMSILERLSIPHCCMRQRLRSAPRHSTNERSCPLHRYFVHSTLGTLHLINPATGRLAYLNNDHLSYDGSKMLEFLLRTEIFDAQPCH
eukprot:COSAG01_NODE_4411_length_5051_cov_3.166397_2_plen_422_part_00